MATTITDWNDWAERLAGMGLHLPSEFAVLPLNLSVAKPGEELVVASSTVTLRKLWKQAGVIETPIEPSENLWPELQQNDFSLVLPALFFGYSIWSQNPNLLNVALGVVSNYTTDFFKGFTGGKKVKLEIIVERVRGKAFKRIQFDGTPDEFKELHKIIREINRDAT